MWLLMLENKDLLGCYELILIQLQSSNTKPFCRIRNIEQHKNVKEYEL